MGKETVLVVSKRQVDREERKRATTTSLTYIRYVSNPKYIFFWENGGTHCRGSGKVKWH